DCLSGRAPGSRGRGVAPDRGADAVHRGREGRAGDAAEPGGRGSPGRPPGDPRHPGCDASVRGAGSSGRGIPGRRRMVPAVSAGKRAREKESGMTTESGIRKEAPPTRRWELRLESPSIANGDRIPTLHAQDGENLSPELRWFGIPKDTAAMALVCEDPDA